ncbi:MAG TPA: FAD-dependent oxidoreductase [Ktedonobacterales bacterium]|nr:FAD-dependent oxidoreductase [Ktedonobacterales bacterium]
MYPHYELVAIGSGPAGESAAVMAATFGRRTAIIERGKPGGVVTTTGGAPTKTLREAAIYLTGFRDRDIYGITVAAPPDVTLSTIAERTRHVCELLQRAVAQNLAHSQVDYLQGSGRLGPNHTIQITAPDGAVETITADIILLATGSRPLHPPNIPFDDPDVCDSDQIFKLGRMPADLCIVGGGAIGVEFATIFGGLGVRVVLSDMADRLLPTMDGELSRLMAQRFAEVGVQVVPGVRTDTIERVDGKLRVSLSNGSTLTPDAVLFAAGRRANTDGLGVEDVGIQLDRHGRIIVDSEYRTSVDGIYAAGDVVAPSLASIAMEQGRVAVHHAFSLPFKKAVDPLAISAVYGVPEVAGVGLTEEQCRDQGLEYAVGRCDLAATPRGAISGHGGLLKLLFRRDDRRLLGVHIFGDIASELVGIGQAVMNSGEPIDVFAALTLNTPTYTYAYKYATFDGLLRLAEPLGGPSALVTLAESAI